MPMDNTPISQEALRSKPLSKEDEFFMKEEMERLRQAALEKAQKESAEEKQRLKELHYMHCPKCGHELLEETHHGILIDRCPHCQGVWLDTGELEQMLKQARKDSFFTNFLKKIR